MSIKNKQIAKVKLEMRKLEGIKNQIKDMKEEIVDLRQEKTDLEN